MTMPAEPVIRSAVPGDEHCLFGTLTAAFAQDPAVRWTYPDDDAYRRDFPTFARLMGGAAIAAGTAHHCEEFAGVALWLPPGIAPDEAKLVAHIERTTIGRDQEALFAVFEEMGRHHPDEPHWYLPLIGIEPSRQGRGLGGALMRHALLQCDHDRLPAYLESSNARNLPLYRRHGFELLGTIQKGSSPPIFPMLRKPR